MTLMDFVQLDVFTTKRFAGNPLAVFPDARGLTTKQMQNLAKETNLSETTFVLPPSKKGADYRVRIFTPVQELDYAGHPSVGTGWHLATSGRLDLDREGLGFHQEVRAGVLPIDVELSPRGHVRRVFTTQARPRFEPPARNRSRVAAALGLDVEDLHAELPVQLTSTGLAWLLVPLRNRAALDRMAPRRDHFVGPKALHDNVYAFTVDPSAPRKPTEARGFPMKEFEDPVTGSASGCLGAYLVKHGLLPSRDGAVRFVHQQGRHLRRPGEVTVQVDVGPSGGPAKVKVGGPCVDVWTGRAKVA